MRDTSAAEQVRGLMELWTVISWMAKHSNGSASCVRWELMKLLVLANRGVGRRWEQSQGPTILDKRLAVGLRLGGFA